MPAVSLAAAMHRMADAGADMVARRDSAAVAIKRHLISEPRSRKKAESREPPTQARGRDAQLLVVVAGRALALEPDGASGCSGGERPPLGVLPRHLDSLWLHGNHHGHRASRLDSAVRRAASPVGRAPLCAAALDEQFRKAEAHCPGQCGCVAAHRGAGCALLGIEPSSDASPGLPCSASSRSVQDAEVEVMNLRADDAALLMAFRRIAALRSTLLSYDLGAPTRHKQALALCKRLLLPLAPRRGPVRARLATRLPQHATVLYCCSECRRVVNSVQDNTGKDLAFNELGLSASMLTVDCTTCTGRRCAKRSSAALRTAVALEASAERLELEQLEPVASPLLPADLRPGDHRCDHVHTQNRRVQEESGVGHGLDFGLGAPRLVVRGGQVSPRPQVVL